MWDGSNHNQGSRVACGKSAVSTPPSHGPNAADMPPKNTHMESRRDRSLFWARRPFETPKGNPARGNLGETLQWKCLGALGGQNKDDHYP